MKFEQSGLEDKIVPFADFREIMEEAGFDAQWDYERCTYDYKILDEVKDDIYYFRFPGVVHEGEFPKESSKVRLLQPYLGKHYYPHGVEYDEVFPERIVEKCKKKIEQVREKLSASAVG
ncbi:YugN family protein [Alkalicoccus luteus]|uniref:YugN-like family protein n=1 Tax=Alkalicoccus luteus TaxID=1237094 RepID=A0A969PR74_9BACI|nr:YugN family protein [Alkalicoccus luteus]NJP36468.1 hypothetical protein [Alkalicoccus luteus]